MNNKKKVNSKYMYIYMYVCFCIFAVMQFTKVGIYFDDYAYFSLNYWVPTPHIGDEYSLSELFRFLREHYSVTSGRVIYFGIMLLLYRFVGFMGVKVCAALILTAILFCLNQIILSDKTLTPSKRFLTAAFICISYGCVTINYHRHCTYWMTAFYLYYLPILFIALFVLLFKKFEKKQKRLYAAILIILAFLSAASFETWSVAVTGTLILLFGYRCCKKKSLAKHELMFSLGGICGSVFLFSSPGIWHRAQSAVDVELSIASRIKQSIASVFLFMFDAEQRLYLVAIFVAALCTAIYLYKNKHCIRYIVYATILSVCAFTEIIEPSMLITLIAFKWQGLLMCLMIFAVLFLSFFEYFIFKKYLYMGLFMMIALFSVFALAVVPSFPERVIVPFMICSFVVIAEGILLLFDFAISSKGYIFKCLTVLACLVFCLCCIANTLKIYNGYKENSVINDYNEQAFHEAQTEASTGRGVNAINLKKYDEANEIYASTTYYSRNEDYLREMILNYYGLDKDIMLNYE